MAKKSSIEKKEICFVIMPYGGWFDQYYEKIYCPAIKKAGLEPHRADDLDRPSAIVPDIWEYTQKAKVILADLTDRNPNVFYELGLAHAITKPAVFITQSLNDVPFDLKALRIIEYDKNLPDWGNELKDRITEYLKNVMVSPNESVPATFLKTTKAAAITQEEINKIATEQEKRLIEIEKRNFLLRRQMENQLRDLRDLSHARPSASEIRLSPSQAKRMIEQYLRRKMPESLIIDRLSSEGVPSGWILKEIREIKEKNRK